MSEVRLASSAEGPDDAPAVILANPIGTTRAIWDAQARVLRENFRLLRFELRGHGVPGARSGAPPGPYSLAELFSTPGTWASTIVTRCLWPGCAAG